VTLRRFSDAGMRAFSDWLDSDVARTGDAVPAELLSGAEFTEIEYSSREPELRSFASRFEWALYARELLSDLPRARVLTDSGLWTWLTAFYFDVAAPLERGQRKLLTRPRYVLQGSDYSRVYRHLLAGPWQLLGLHDEAPEVVRPFLLTPVPKVPDLYEQFASRLDTAAARPVLALAGRLYFDKTTGRLRRGAGGKGKGSPRRLAALMRQLDVNFDLYSASVEQLHAMLPREFAAFG
jgi:hypothetical protein